MPHPSDHLKSLIRSNAEEIARLHARVHETRRERSRSEQKRQEWQRACQEFHARYDALAFPGGLKGAFERLAAGDAHTMEAAICFLEIRPYYFRSGYLFESLIRKARHAPLSQEQTARLEHVRQAFSAWRAGRRAKNKLAVE